MAPFSSVYRFGIVSDQITPMKYQRQFLRKVCNFRDFERIGENKNEMKNDFLYISLFGISAVLISHFHQFNMFRYFEN